MLSVGGRGGALSSKYARSLFFFNFFIRFTAYSNRNFTFKHEDFANFRLIGVWPFHFISLANWNLSSEISLDKFCCYLVYFVPICK